MSVRVLSVPTGHVYVRHLAAEGPVNPVDPGDSVVRLADPAVPGRSSFSQWWPPPSLQSRWVLDNQDSFDLVHLHFGFDSRSPDQLAAWAQTLRWLEKPLVYTVHDLRNPHHRTPGVHDAQLDVLIPAADALITLTPGAAAEIDRRWDRRATVLPHPHVVPLPLISAPRPQHDTFVVGVHLKSLRAGMDPLPVVDSLTKVLSRWDDARLRVDVHTDVMTPGSSNHDAYVATTLRLMADDGLIDLRVHDYFSDDDLWDYLSSLDVAVLPYRFGTHSGWLEACFDLGTTVVAPSCGYFSEQRPTLRFGFDEDGLDTSSLEEALIRAHKERPVWRATPQARTAERALLAREHLAIYSTVLNR